MEGLLQSGSGLKGDSIVDRYAFMSVFVVEALTKGGWSVGTDCGNESSLCTRGILCVCVFGVLFLSGRKDGTVFTGKSARGCLFRAESGGNGVRQKFAVDL